MTRSQLWQGLIIQRDTLNWYFGQRYEMYRWYIYIYWYAGNDQYRTGTTLSIPISNNGPVGTRKTVASQFVFVLVFKVFWRSKKQHKTGKWFPLSPTGLLRPGLFSKLFVTSSVKQNYLTMPPEFQRNNYGMKYHHYREGREGMEVNQQDLYFFFSAKMNIMMSSILAKLYLFLGKNLMKKKHIIITIPMRWSL